MNTKPSLTHSISFAIFTLLIAMLSIQSGASLAKHIFPVVGAQGATFFRLVFASLILVIAWRPWRFKITTSQFKVVLAYGASLGIMNLLFYLSLVRIPLGVAVALEFTGPLALTFYSSRKPVDFVWGALAVLGIYLISPLQEAAMGVDPIGALLALGAGVCWAFYIIFGQKALKSEAPLGAVSSYGMIVAALFAAPFGVSSLVNITIDTKLILTAIGLAVLSSALPYTLEMFALRRLPAKNFGILMSIEPAVAAGAGFFFLKEALTTQQMLAIVCVIAASVGSTLTTRTSEATLPVE